MRFFSRELVASARSVRHHVDLVSPSDGKIMGFGRISPDAFNVGTSDGDMASSDWPNVMVKHVKGFQFPLRQFLGEPFRNADEGTNGPAHVDTMSILDNMLPSKDVSGPTLAVQGPSESFFSVSKLKSAVRSFIPSSSPSGKSLYYLSIYLAPGDYHRFHAPCQFDMEKVRHIFGESFPVAPLTLRWIPSIYALNERRPCLGHWKYGRFTVTPVGSTNVGNIVIHGDPKKNGDVIDRHSKEGRWTEMRKWLCSGYDVAPWKSTEDLLVRRKFEKGQEMGYFEMGSTVVLVFEAPENFQFLVEESQSIRMGDPLGSCL